MCTVPDCFGEPVGQGLCRMHYLRNWRRGTTDAPNYLKYRGAELTADLLREILHYDLETGIFTWRVKTCSKLRVGQTAGYVNDKGKKAHGYVVIFFGRRPYFAHRLAILYVTGEWPEEGLEVDHRDRVRSNNRYQNLRVVTHAVNQQNRTPKVKH